MTVFTASAATGTSSIEYLSYVTGAVGAVFGIVVTVISVTKRWVRSRETEAIAKSKLETAVDNNADAVRDLSTTVTDLALTMKQQSEVMHANTTTIQQLSTDLVRLGVTLNSYEDRIRALENGTPYRRTTP